MKDSLITEELCKDLKIIRDELCNGPEHQKDLDTELHKNSRLTPHQPDLLDHERIDD